MFGWELELVGDTDEFRYATARVPGHDDQVAGVMDASSFLPDGVSARWAVYWEVADAGVVGRPGADPGGSIVDAAQDTPYGRIATASDPAGAVFRLRTGPHS